MFLAKFHELSVGVLQRQKCEFNKPQANIQRVIDGRTFHLRYQKSSNEKKKKSSLHYCRERKVWEKFRVLLLHCSANRLRPWAFWFLLVRKVMHMRNVRAGIFYIKRPWRLWLNWGIAPPYADTLRRNPKRTSLPWIELLYLVYNIRLSSARCRW